MKRREQLSVQDELAAVLEEMYRCRTFGIKLGLHVEEALLDRLEHPEQTFASIHIAGTNGKGSVAAMLASILTAMGIRTGLYTSPHLVRINERFQVNGEPISDADLLECIRAVQAASTDVAAALNQEPTFFERSTAIAFEHFRRSGVQMAVVETGMGGRLDATNVLTPVMSIITRLGLDHAQYLGTTIEQIAAEKAGIIKLGRPVVAGAMDEAAMQVIARTASEKGSVLAVAPDTVNVAVTKMGLDGQRVEAETEALSYGRLDLPLLGAHQAENLATALAALDMLDSACGVRVPAEIVREGLKKVKWPGRLQVLSTDPPVILDGAHNPDAARALVQALRKLSGKRPLGLVLGMCADKDRREFLHAFGGGVQRAWTITIGNERAIAADELAAEARSMGWNVQPTDRDDALRNAVAWAREKQGMLCLTGSLFWVGEVLELIEKGEFLRPDA